ncbi:hypothetical protein M513_10663 [Trichuris suis]|uniref:Uncharacterized protein n=1 Tax=Trichuris suis TaxID=68888 RepID=A0A085LTZ9_9BILA|nr:hypothetical protein M513_10663 [Trichuris suis]
MLVTREVIRTRCSLARMSKLYLPREGAYDFNEAISGGKPLKKYRREQPSNIHSYRNGLHDHNYVHTDLGKFTLTDFPCRSTPLNNTCEKALIYQLSYSCPLISGEGTNSACTGAWVSMFEIR